MYRSMARRFPVPLAVILGCWVALILATSAWAASQSRVASCTDTQCVLVKSAPAVAKCRIIGPSLTNIKSSASAHVKAKQAQTRSVKSKAASTSKKAVARKQAPLTSKPKQTSSSKQRSSRAGR